MAETVSRETTISKPPESLEEYVGDGSSESSLDLATAHQWIYALLNERDQTKPILASIIDDNNHLSGHPVVIVVLTHEQMEKARMLIS